MNERKPMTLPEAIAWLGPRYVLARPLPRLDRRPQPEQRPVPDYIKLPMWLQEQAA
jgi:hypothetical protein